MIKVAGRGGGIIAVQDKRRYHKPVITCYGTVKTLTASGTGHATETTTNAGNNPCTSDIHKKPCLSDRRTKENIVRVGCHSLGIGLYLFDYKPPYRQIWGHRRQFGVMADEVKRVLPEAASVHADGYKMVDYAMLGISRTLEQVSYVLSFMLDGALGRAAQDFEQFVRAVSLTTLSPKSPSPLCHGECYGTLGGSALRRGNLYRYADTVIASAWSLGGLPPVEFLASDEARIDIRLMDARPSEPAKADWIHHWPPQRGGLSLALSDKGEGFLLRFPGLADFSISINGRQVKAWPSPSTDKETLCHLLLDQVLPRVLAHQGRLVLHAGAVRVGDRALSVMGDTGSGKSTLTASFHGAGCPLLSDDGLVLTQQNGVTLALPIYTSLRLWPDAIAGIYAQRPAVAPMAHYSSKRRIVVRDIAAKNVPIPLASLYVLGLAAYDGRVSLRRLSPADACMAIIGNSFQLDVTDRCRAADVLAVASRIARHLPVFSLAYPRDFARLPEVHEAILRHHSE